MNEYMDRNWAGLEWSQWISFEESRTLAINLIPTMQPGFYRVRAQGTKTLTYIGQTGRCLRERTRDLVRNATREIGDPPWNDPHTAAPALWAFKHEDGMEFEYSVAIDHLSTPVRQCKEDSLLYRYRLAVGESTLCNHGRFHPCWTRPSNKKKGLGMQRQTIPIEYTSLPPVSGGGSPNSDDWLQLDWSERQSVNDVTCSSAGVYRIFLDDEVTYIGESTNIGNRLRDHRMRPAFKSAEASFSTMESPVASQLKERETDLLGAFFLTTGQVPRTQYGKN